MQARIQRQTEAAAAGALHVQLAGDAWYFGELHKKPFIGDDIRPIEVSDIAKINRMMYTAAALALAGVRSGSRLALLLGDLTLGADSSKSPALIAQSNKQWAGTCLYQKWYKPLLISCEVAIRL